MNRANKIATIVPKAHFDEIKDDGYFMGLVHAAEADKEYFDFFKARATEGKYVILDNSTVELGRPFDAHQYLVIASEMGASEVCLPDFLHESTRTLEAARAFLNMVDFDTNTLDFMAIPQGNSFSEWVDCALQMLEMPIDTIGISCRYTNMFGNRAKAALCILPFLKKHGVKIHLLGNYLQPEEEVAPLLEWKYVRGVDSSTPCVFTQHRLFMGNDHKSPEHHHIDFLKDSYDPELLHYNIQAWRKGCSTCLH